MLRRTSVLLAAGLLLVLMASHAQAQELGGVGSEAWTGGNGWCSAGLCFRAWPEPQGIEVRWLVEPEGATPLVLMRMQLQPALGSPTPVAKSGCLGEFTYLDEEVIPGALYRYELVRPGDLAPLGAALEAGVTAQAVDPGGSAGYQVYLPLTLSH